MKRFNLIPFLIAGSIWPAVPADAREPGYGSANPDSTRISCAAIPFPVANENDLTQAINNANNETSCPGSDVIDLGNNRVVLTQALPDIVTSMSIQNGTIERSASSANFRLLRLNAPGERLDLIDLALFNGSTIFGAAVYATGGFLNIEGSAIWGNSSDYGALRAFGDDTRVVVSDSSFNFNTASFDGGAIGLSSGAQAFIVNTTFTDNTALGDGGAVHLVTGISPSSTSLLMINVSLRGNEADDGGAIYSAGNTDLINVLMSGNLAGNRGGGIFVSDDTNVGVDLELLNVTIAGNRAVDVSGGGGIRMEGGDADVDNSIVWGNLSGTAGGFSSDNTTINTGSATIGFSRTVLEGGTPFGATNDAANYYTDPLFVDPVTPSTGNMPNADGNYRFFEGSPAIDQGNNFDVAGGRAINSIEHDLDRTARIQNSFVDLGAYEGGEPLLFPNIMPTPDSIDFGAVPPGQSSAAETVSVENTGPGSLTIGMITLEGPAPGNFQIVPGSDQCSGQTVAPSSTCQLDIRFTPQDAGVQTARVRIPSDDPDGSAFVELLGSSGVLFYDGFE